MKNTPWPYEHTRERIAENAAALGSGALLCFGLSQIFNPVALAAAVGYGAFRTAFDLGRMTHPQASDRFLAKTNALQSASDDYPEICDLVLKFSHAANIKPPRLTLASDDYAIKNLSWISRRRIKRPEYHGTFMSRVMFSNPAMHYIGTTHEFIKSHSPETVRFALAHEVAHIKSKDHLKAFTLVSLTQHHIMRFLYAGIAIAGGALLAGISTPLSALVIVNGWSGALWAGGVLGLTAIASKFGMNYASRLRELRADRNAVYLTGETRGMSRFLMMEGGCRPPGMIWEWGSYPSSHRRLMHLHTAYALASQYPPAASATHRESAHPSRSGQGGPRLF